ncbi:hypothetical protein ACSBR2_004906 [Camellia fascicularis]
MDEKKREIDGDNGGKTEKTKGVGEEDGDEAMKKCLEENKGDNKKCKSMVESFKSSSPPPPTNKPITPLRLRSGSLTDV